MKRYQIRKVPHNADTYWYELWSKAAGMLAPWRHEQTYTTISAAQEALCWLRDYDKHQSQGAKVVYDTAVNAQSRVDPNE